MLAPLCKWRGVINLCLGDSLDGLKAAGTSSTLLLQQRSFRCIIECGTCVGSPLPRLASRSRRFSLLFFSYSADALFMHVLQYPLRPPEGVEPEAEYLETQSQNFHFILFSPPWTSWRMRLRGFGSHVKPSLSWAHDDPRQHARKRRAALMRMDRFTRRALFAVGCLTFLLCLSWHTDWRFGD